MEKKEDDKNRDFWEQVSLLYSQAADLSEDDLAAFLERYSTDDPLRRELEALLAVRKRSARYFDSLAENVHFPTDEELFDAPADTGRVGSYSIIKKIGRGGMGTVYLAERADESYQSRVAIKILRRGLDTDDILARFRIERQILARLNHPNITHLHDGGLTSDGRPYFVMEYIEGLPITDWCDQQRLTINQRLKLFFQVCEALQYAHQNLVIHRDLKPGNILVTEKGQVKLLDFGIAKLLDDDAGNPATLASAGFRLMTPEYASPEQIRGLPINTSSDIYQLGLVLYELLCGQAAYTFSDRSFRERERVILEQVPMNPSLKANRAEKQELAEICNARLSTPGQLRKKLKGDLDAITIKALHKEAGRRFSSIAELKEDIVRYLDGLPVHARGGNIRYTTGKYLRRNRKGLAVTGGFVVLLLMLGFFHSRSITHERNIALHEAAKSEQIKDFVVDLMQSLDPSEVRGEPVSATLLLDRGARRVLDSDHQAPDVRGELLLTIAEVYENLGLYDQSQEMLTALFEHINREPHGMDLLGIRARQQQAMLYSELGEYEKAFALYDEIKEDLETRYPGEKELVANLYSDYALNFRVMGNLDMADSLFQTALRMHEELYDPQHPNLTRVMSRYATVLSDQMRHDEARIYQEGVLESDREHFGDIHPRVLREMTNLATTQLLLEEYADADSLYTRAGELSQRLYGEKNAVLGLILNNHATAKTRLGHYREALNMQQEVLELRNESGIYDHPSTGVTTLGMSAVLLELERYEEARAKAEESIELFGYGLPTQHWLYDRAWLVFYEASLRLGQFTPDMVEPVRRSYENLKEERGSDDEYTRRARSLLTEMEAW